MIILILFTCLIVAEGPHLPAATFTVDIETDTVDINPGDGTAADASGNCSLRAAIMEANALYGPDTIVLPEGTFKITIEGSREDQCETGDLDIFSHLTIQGAGKTLTIIDGNQLDRVFHILKKRQVNISGLTVQGGRAPAAASEDVNPRGEHGGGIFNLRGTLSLSHCRIVNNSGGSGHISYNDPHYNGGHGGGIYNREGTVTIEDSEINFNSSGQGGKGSNNNPGGHGGDGGGIYNHRGAVTLIGCTVCYNNCGLGNWGRPCTFRDGDGGGICNIDGTLILRQCEVADNRCSYYDSYYWWYGSKPGWGAGIYNGGSSSEAVLENCTASQNSTQNSGHQFGHGGGIYNSAVLTLSNCTVYGNIIEKNYYSQASSGYGGGVYNETGATLKIHNTIIAGNRIGDRSHGPDVYGTVTSKGYNILTITDGCTVTGDTTGNIYEQDPRLAPLSDNGGLGRTHTLQPGSPAIDAADPDDFPGTDQRGVYRPKDSNHDGTPRADIGAFELAFPTIAITHPQANAVLSGSVLIQADTNSRYVDFAIDGQWQHTAEESPYTYQWDTTLRQNGGCRLRATAYDIPDLYAFDKITVQVDNTLIQLEASQGEERGWLTHKQYARLTFTVRHTGTVPPTAFVIERKDNNGSFQAVREISASQLENGVYTGYDLLANREIAYTYRVKAVDNTGMVVGISQEITI